MELGLTAVFLLIKLVMQRMAEGTHVLVTADDMARIRADSAHELERTRELTPIPESPSE